ncbi:hypothetical protein BCR39DRAFT_560104 [Naematelia encephala]|uniref:Uncharacterized protein n=1 Tax=Naematelia encephala TaxID=71784 RepID=A0A1Y2AXT0_9TREE|nr:hypothetical protein BCR39DRAFT_560104 [Naematelia encephala]
MHLLGLLALALTSTSVLAEVTAGSVFDVAKKVVTNALTGKVPSDISYLDTTDEEAKVVRIDDRNASVLNEGNWVILVHAPPRRPLDRAFMQVHSNASLAYHEFSPELSASAETPMEEFHFARIDFMDAVEISTRWMVWRPPKIVIIENQGPNRSIRFISNGNIPLNGTTLFRAIRDETYRQVPTWESNWAPGGDKAWIIDYYLAAMAKWSEKTSRIPNFVWLMLSGYIAKELLGWLHSARGNTQVPTTTTTTTTPLTGSAAAAARAQLRARAAAAKNKPKSQ